MQTPIRYQYVFALLLFGDLHETWDYKQKVAAIKEELQPRQIRDKLMAKLP